jgi:hypothetical protein
MPNIEQPDVPIWAAAKARKQIDIVREAAKTIADTERERASRPIDRMTEVDLEAEQLRLEEMLHIGTMTVDDFRRLREIDFYLEGMRQRKQYSATYEEWSPEPFGD